LQFACTLKGKDVLQSSDAIWLIILNKSEMVQILYPKLNLCKVCDQVLRLQKAQMPLKNVLPMM